MQFFPQHVYKLCRFLRETFNLIWIHQSLCRPKLPKWDYFLSKSLFIYKSRGELFLLLFLTGVGGGFGSSLRTDVGLRRTCAYYRTSARAMCVRKCVRKGFWNCACDVCACSSFLACDVRLHFCKLFEQNDKISCVGTSFFSNLEHTFLFLTSFSCFWTSFPFSNSLKKDDRKQERMF